MCSAQIVYLFVSVAITSRLVGDVITFEERDEFTVNITSPPHDSLTSIYVITRRQDFIIQYEWRGLGFSNSHYVKRRGVNKGLKFVSFISKPTGV